MDLKFICRCPNLSAEKMRMKNKDLVPFRCEPLSRRRLHTQDRISNMPNAPRTVKDVPAQEFVIALAQYFRSTGKVRLASAITRLPVKISRGERRLGALDTTAATRRRKENMRKRP